MPSVRLLSSTSKNDDDLGDFDNLDDFDDVGELNAEDLNDKPSVKLDPKQSLELNYADIGTLKGMDLKERADLLRERTQEEHQTWQKQLDQMREDTEKKFEYSEAEMAAIDGHELPKQDEPWEYEDAIMEKRGKMSNEEIAAGFGKSERKSITIDGEEFPVPQYDSDEDYDNIRMPIEDVYDPAAFPSVMDPYDNILEKRKGKCIFCLGDPSKNRVKEITYTNVQLLHRFINERGMITTRRFNYNCAKHQRQVARSIKHARYIGLLSYVDNFYAPESFALGNFSLDAMNRLPQDFAQSQEFDAWNVPEGSGAVVQGKAENPDEVLPYAELKAKYGDTPKGPKKLF